VPETEKNTSAIESVQSPQQPSDIESGEKTDGISAEIKNCDGLKYAGFETDRYRGCIIDLAVKEKESTICNYIETMGRRELCLERIAQVTNDLNYCKNKYPDRSTKEKIDIFNDCIVRIGAGFSDIEKGNEMCIQATFSTEKCICLAGLYNQQQDPSKCAELETKFSCPNEKKNEPFVQDLGFVDNCYWASLNNGSYSETCEKIVDSQFRQECTAYKIPSEAIATKNPLLCDVLNGNPYAGTRGYTSIDDCKKYAGVG
jgi:hypothetical protein